MLYKSLDGKTWTDVTPTTASTPIVQSSTSQYEELDGADFISPQDGLMVGCAQALSRETVYQTDDGGRTWTSRPGRDGCYHGIDDVDMVTPDYLISSNTCIGIPCNPVVESTDGGPWLSLATYGDGDRAIRPTYPVEFITPQVGFSASLIGQFQADDSWQAGFFATFDSGRTWIQEQPPTPSPISPQYDLPTFLSSQYGILPTLSGPASDSKIAIDVTYDGGHTWRPAAQLPFPGASQTIDNYPYVLAPEARILDASTWWVTRPGRTTQFFVTSDSGRSWTSAIGHDLPGPVSDFEAIDSDHALALVPIAQPGNIDQTYVVDVYETADCGATWKPLIVGGLT